MSILHGIFCIILGMFTIVQFNDADFYFWIPVYGVPAILAGTITMFPDSPRYWLMRTVLTLCSALSVAGTIVFWPQETSFWHKSVWWQSEAARESMGMMIVACILLVITTRAWCHGRRNRY